MKKKLEPFFILLLVLFSFFYTDKVMNLVNKKDPLMIELGDKSSTYKVDPVNAIINNNTIIPGMKGKEIDLDKSYEEMKLGGVFREEALVYKDIYPSSSIINNKDKYIVKGNSNKNEVAILFIINNNINIENIKKIKNMSLFISSSYLNTTNINKLKTNEIYSYGKNGIYSDEILTSDNALINRISNNKSIYCLTKEKNDEVLKICNQNNMYVIIPNIIGDYHDIKNNLSSGSIILLDSLNNIDSIVRYINSKGYTIVGLNKLIEE